MSVTEEYTRRGYDLAVKHEEYGCWQLDYQWQCYRALPTAAARRHIRDIIKSIRMNRMLIARLERKFPWLKTSTHAF